MKRNRIFVMSFGLGGNSGDGITKDGNAYSSSWYLSGPDEFLKYIPKHYDPSEVDGCIVIDKREVLERCPASRSGRRCARPFWATERLTASRTSRASRTALCLMRSPRAMGSSAAWPHSPLSPSPIRAMNPAHSISSARLRTPPGGRGTVLALVFCTASPRRTSSGHRLREDPRRTPSSSRRGRWSTAALSLSRKPPRAFYPSKPTVLASGSLTRSST